MRTPRRFRAARLLLRWILGRLFQVELVGLANVGGGPYLLSCNHLSWVDPFLLLAWLPVAPRVHMLGSRKAIYNRRFKRWVLDFMGGVIPVDHGQPDKIGEAVAFVLEAGGAVALFPEGGIGPIEGQLLPLRHGIVHFAQNGRFPTLPAGISGSRDLWRGKPIRIAVGPALALDSHDLAASVARLEAAMRELLPGYQDPPGPRRWRWLTHLLR
jgi:1-acyl-sn-glycerol-3-phosphate acyltransferase